MLALVAFMDSASSNQTFTSIGGLRRRVYIEPDTQDFPAGRMAERLSGVDRFT